MGSRSTNSDQLFPDGESQSGTDSRAEESSASVGSGRSQTPVLITTKAANAEKHTLNADTLSLPPAEPDAIAQSWLTAQCDMIAGTSCGLVVYRDVSTDQIRPVALWPESHTAIPQRMLDATLDAYRDQTFVVISDDETDNCYIASTLRSGEAISPIAVFELPDAVRSQQQAIFQLLQWGAVWFGLLHNTGQAPSTQSPLATVVDVLARNLEQSEFDSAAIVLVTELASRLSCTRVSLGLVHNNAVSLVAVSNTAKVDQRSNHSRDISAAMDEAVDQNATLACPMVKDGLPYVAYAQEVLARRSGKASVLSTPLYAGNTAIGAITLERDGTEGFDHDTIKLCEVLAALVGPVIELKREKERPIGRKVLTSIGGFVSRLFGARHIAMKLYAILLIACVLFLSFATGDYRITSPARLEGSVMRAVTAPRDGFVASAAVRAGDIVEVGDKLASLENRELQLEQLKLESQRAQLDKEYRAAMSSHDRSTTAIVNARNKQTQAKLALIEEQLARTQLSAPIGGIVVSGDLSQSIGAPVENGQVLFEITPLNAYRVILEIDERDIGEISITQQGTLTLTGLPDEALSFTVDRIVPLSTARDGRNFFEVQAELDAPSSSIRPGMEGVAKVMIDQRKLVWVWTHEFLDWLRLTFWAWTQ